MDEKQLTSEMRAAARKTRRGPNCLDEHELAGLASGYEGIDGHDRMQVHLSECSYCLEQVADLAAMADDNVESFVGELTIHKAQALVEQTRDVSHVARWATAAVIVLALGVVYLNTGFQPGISNAPITAPEGFRESRNIGNLKVGPNVLSPNDGSTLKATGGPIEWTEVMGSLYYDVRIVSLDGELIGEQRVTQPHWDVPAGMLHPGNEYYVRVDAFLAEAKRLSSSHVLFTVEPD